MDFIQRIKQKQWLYYIGKCIKNVGNKEFRAKVLDLDTTPKMVMFHHNGNAYPGKIIYYYKTGGVSGGFFGTFRCVLGALNYADQLGMLPVIEWDRSMRYCDESMDAITMNPFEYYFKQPGGISLAEISQVSNLVIGKGSDSSFRRDRLDVEYDESMGHAGYVWDCRRFEELAMVMKKYIKLTDKVQNQIVTDIGGVGISGNTLGVQVRRLGFQYGTQDHPIPVELDDYITAIDKLISRGEYDTIFLATEEESSLAAMIDRFGDKVVYYKDIIRNNIGDTFSSVSSDRKHHHFLLGYEVLRDACTLAMCKSLVTGLSNVSMHAKIMKLSMDSDYSEEVILNNGIVSKGLSVKRASKKFRHRVK